MRQIEAERQRIATISSRDGVAMGGEHIKKGRILAMQKHLEDLKIRADINDPVIKKRFEDGEGKLHYSSEDPEWNETDRK